jgi:5-methylcytosine-specific restriction endonuclease McrA
MSRQKSQCPYFGVPITIGVDAELDHIVPRAKGGTNDISNLQFVHVWANLIKADLDEAEFLRRLDTMLPIIQAKRDTRQIDDLPRVYLCKTA